VEFDFTGLLLALIDVPSPVFESAADEQPAPTL
jgi:hypothetical protein